jgi:hypothetical protein
VPAAWLVENTVDCVVVNIVVAVELASRNKCVDVINHNSTSSTTPTQLHSRMRDSEQKVTLYFAFQSLTAVCFAVARIQ